MSSALLLLPDVPALLLAPMQGLTDAPMRAFQGEAGAFTFAVSEFLRVNADMPPPKVFRRHVPELGQGGRTRSGLPVQVQLLGGDAGRMAEAAVAAYKAGAQAMDINFGCPAPTVNRHDGGATLLKHPQRIREIVRAVRDALPPDVPVSAKLRLGWDYAGRGLGERRHGGGGRGGLADDPWADPRPGLHAPGLLGTDRRSPRPAGHSRSSPTGTSGRSLTCAAAATKPAASTSCWGAERWQTPVFPARRPAPSASRRATRTSTRTRLSTGSRPCSRLVALTEMLDGKLTPQMVCRLKQWLNIAHQRGTFAAFERGQAGAVAGRTVRGAGLGRLGLRDPPVPSGLL